LATLDYAVVVFYLALMVGFGWYFSRQQHTSKDFLLAGRSMGWFPIGLSVMATLISALSYTGVPAAAYGAGLKLLAWPLALWLTLPIVTGLVLPIYRNLEIVSIYEYLELRYNQSTRIAGSVVFVFWRLTWLGGVLYAPCKVLVVAAGLDINLYALLIVLGAVSTAYTFLGGMKAVIWTDVIQTSMMLAGIVFIICGVWMSLDGGAGRVWEVAQNLERTEVVRSTPEVGETFWSDQWLLWAMLPHLILANLSFVSADQITAQRFLTARSTREANRSFTLSCAAVSVIYPGLIYIGLALLAYYHDFPAALQSAWETDELMPRFIVNVLPAGLAGLIFAALLAASMSSMDSGLNSLATLVITDIYRRLGWGMSLVARLRGKSREELDDVDELWICRWLVMFFGIVATIFALLVSQLGDIFAIMVSVSNTFGGPLMGIVLLGMLTRRCTAPAALIALALGTVFTVWLAFGDTWGVCPWDTKLATWWPLTIGFVGTVLVGYLLSFVLGRRKTEHELRGLVLGVGELGKRVAPRRAK